MTRQGFLAPVKETDVLKDKLDVKLQPRKSEKKCGDIVVDRSYVVQHHQLTAFFLLHI